MADRPQKKRKTVDCAAADTLARRLLHVGGISNAGLAKIMGVFKNLNHDEVEAMCEANIRVAFTQTFDRLSTVIRMPLISGCRAFDWELLDPNKLLAESVARSPALQEVFAAACRRCPPTQANPWSLVVGFDEVVPGNKLQLDHTRKAMNLSFTFRELGQSMVGNELVWFTPVCVRSRMIAQCRGARD